MLEVDSIFLCNNVQYVQCRPHRQRIVLCALTHNGGRSVAMRSFADAFCMHTDALTSARGFKHGFLLDAALSGELRDTRHYIAEDSRLNRPFYKQSMPGKHKADNLTSTSPYRRYTLTPCNADDLPIHSTRSGLLHNESVVPDTSLIHHRLALWSKMVFV